MSVDLSKLLELKNAINNRGFSNSEQSKGNLGNKPKASGGYNANKGSKPNKQDSATGRGGYNNNATNPTAPYNFIKLNDRIVRPPIAEVIGNATDAADVTSRYSKYIKSGKKFTGYFDICVKNLTPLYIAGEDGFFSNGKDICIPGSSMRGCLKNTFKIITNSAFRSDKENPDLADKYLYFRSFASAFKPMREAYSGRMTQIIDDKTRSVAKAGFIVREGKTYYLCPAQHRAIKARNDYEANSGNPPKWCDDFVDVVTGKMQNKTHFYRISNPVWNKKMMIPEEIINGYVDDKNRKGANVLADKYNGKADGNHKLRIFIGAEKYDFVAPCFYVAENDVVSHFGAGPYYRIPYRKKISAHVPANINLMDIDFADAVFGRKAEWSSRVFFEDLYLDKESEGNKEDKEYRKILANPNPTSFQFYLEKDGNNAATWDGNTNIRGYKMYWHKNIQWQEKNPKYQNDKMTEKIAPLAKGNAFVGRIRFENLDEVELGALCALFSLGKEGGICYKLGKGKPIGMGTIKLSAKLYVQSGDYYSTLFDDNGFAKCVEEKDIQDFTDTFNAYMQKQLTGTSLALYNERMKELRLIMSTNNMQKPTWNDETRYMDINNKKDREILNKRIPLPTISEVVKIKK